MTFHLDAHAVVYPDEVIGRIRLCAVALAAAEIGIERSFNAPMSIGGEVAFSNRVTAKYRIYAWNGIVLDDDVFRDSTRYQQ